MLNILVALFTAASLVAIPSQSTVTQTPRAKKRAVSPQEMFERGKQIVDANCDDCETNPNSHNELLEGIALLKQALRGGYRDQAAVHRLLMVAYGSLGMTERRHSELLALVKADPTDLDARTDWIETLSYDEQIVELKKITTEAPKYSTAHYMLAAMFFARRNLPEGTKSVHRWLETAGHDEIVDHTLQVFSNLSIDDMRKVLKADPSIYPANRVIALQLLGVNDVQGALQHARLALAGAPPAVALHYASQIGGSLHTSGHDKEAVALRREFAAKLKSAEDR